MEPILRTTGIADWVTILLFSSLFFVILAKSLFYPRFLNFIILPFNNKYIFMYNKKEKLMNWFTVFMTIFQLINFSVFLFFCWLIFTETISGEPILEYLIFLGALVLFLIIKIIVQIGNGFVFGNNKVFSVFLFKKITYLNYSGLLMFVTNVALSYIFPGSKTIVYITIALIILINGIGWVGILQKHQKFIANNILYLCALELAPFIILGSLL